MRRFWPLPLVLASVWGASYLFVKVAVEGGRGLLLILAGVALGSDALGSREPEPAGAPAR